MVVLTGCATSHQWNVPVEAATGSIDETGFGRSTTVSSFASTLGGSLLTSTRVGQAASVVDGERGDRLWRISSDGVFLEYCRLLDDRPRDCSVVTLPFAAPSPTLIEPRNLGGGTYYAETSNVSGSSSASSGWTVKGGTLPTTPGFGVWVTASPPLSVATLNGVIRVGAALAFCYLDESEHPRCIPANVAIAGALSVHVLDAAPPLGDAIVDGSAAGSGVAERATPSAVSAASVGSRAPLHVLWAQPSGEGIAMRCEADERAGTVKCETAKETQRR